MMKPKSQLMLAILGAAAVALLFVKLMYDMNGAMSEMTGYVGSLSRDVAQMKTSMDGMAANMAGMNASMRRIEASMQGMGRAIGRGSEQFQQWNPMQMLQGEGPGDRQPGR